jgi:hypothetical protein
MWQGSQNLPATQKESRTQNKQMTPIGYGIWDTEEIVKASWSLCHHDGAASFKLSERSPWPPAVSEKNLHGRRPQILNVRRIGTIPRHPVESDQESTPQSISVTEAWLNRNGYFDNADDGGDNCAAHFKSNIGTDNTIHNPQCPE